MPKNLYLRNGIYWARFKVKGIVYRESLRTRSLTVAERRVKAARQAIEDRVWYGASEAVTWQAAVVSWSQAWSKLEIGKNTGKRYVSSIGQLRAWLDDVDVQRIDTALLKRIVSDRAKHGATNATIRRDLTAISSVLGHCVDEGWLDSNPARTFDRSRIKEKRDPVLLPSSAAIALVTAKASRFTDMAEFSRETGMREEEIASLTHAQLDRSRMAATLERTKGRRVRQVPLSSAALEIIDRQPQYLRSPFVFWRGDGERFKNVGAQFYSTVRRVARKAAQDALEFRTFRFHDLRHYFAVRYLVERRGSLYDLQIVLGHASIKTTEGYLEFLTPDEQRAAIQGVAQSGSQDERFAEADNA